MRKWCRLTCLQEFIDTQPRGGSTDGRDWSRAIKKPKQQK